MGEVARLEDEHHDLRKSLAEIDELLGAAEDLEPISVRLEVFITELRTHFAFEEKGELFSDIASLRPSFDRKVGQLFRQHAEILELFIAARALAVARSELDEVCSATRKAVKMLLGHERAEMDLVQEAALTDLGDGD
jgi:hypothetical protein